MHFKKENSFLILKKIEIYFKEKKNLEADNY